MRVLVITDAWQPQINGVVRTYERLCTALRGLGHTVKIIGPSTFPLRLPLPGYTEIELTFFSYERLRTLVENYEADHIHIATEGPLGWAARRYCLRADRPFTTAYHTHFPDYADVRIARFLPGLRSVARGCVARALRLFHAPAHAVLISTKSLEERLKELGFRNEFRFMSRGVDPGMFHPGDKTLFQDLKRPVALYTGRVAIEKNIEDFLKMEWPGSKVIVGDGPSLAALSKKYPDIRFTGKKTGRALAEHYRSADVFVFPSRTDTFGLVILEALASGLPVAAYNVPGPRDIITQPFLGALDEGNLHAAACRALALGGDAPRRQDYVYRHYTWNEAARQFLQAAEYVHTLKKSGRVAAQPFEKQGALS